MYGDLERAENCVDVAAEIASRLEQTAHLNPGLNRHAALVAAFIRLGELVQGVADAEFGKAGADNVSPLQRTGSELLLALAQAIKSSWESGFREQAIPRWQDQLSHFAEAVHIRTKQAEGFAFYALYPESYIAAATGSDLSSDTVVIGIRSIGASLAALVAAGLGAGPAATVRPSGHPFDRKLSIAPRLAEEILRNRAVPFAIVDEGPGYSGSSFNCVADWLVQHGIGEQQIHFFPSHGGGLGGAAQEAHRRRWASAKRHVVDFDAAALGGNGLSSWASEAIGELTAPLEDLSGGRWRDLKPRASALADTALEKRKFLARSARGTFLVKFSGLGALGERKFALGQQLGGKGLSPGPVALCYGFVVEPWMEGSELPLPLSKRQVEQVGRYLAYRASLEAPNAGATLAALFEMAAYNGGQSLGAEIEQRIRAALGDSAGYNPQPCCTDNRLHRWEWLLSDDGQLLKTDAVDHHAAHDLVGCQDITWDIAGALVELALTPEQLVVVLNAVSRRLARSVDERLLGAMEICYLAFQIGLWTQAQARSGSSEQPRLAKLVQSYSNRLLGCIARQECSIDQIPAIAALH